MKWLKIFTLWMIPYTTGIIIQSIDSLLILIIGAVGMMIFILVLNKFTGFDIWPEA